MNTIAQVLVGLCWCVYARAATLIQPEWGYYYDLDDQGAGTYSFGYDVEDPASLNVQFRRERRLPNGTVTGSYGLVEPDGNIKIVRYVADPLGYRAWIENSKREDEMYPPVPATPWEARRPYWHSLWDLTPPRDHQQSLQTLGTPVHEQRTPPASLVAGQSQSYADFLQTLDTPEKGHRTMGTDSAADQSQSYPAFLPPLQHLV